MASNSACWRWATPLMWSSAPSARRSTNASRRSAASAWSSASIAISILRACGAIWIARAVKALAPAGCHPRHGYRGRFRTKPGTDAAKPEFVEAEITEHIDLNSSRSDKETIHLALAFDGAAPAYEPGDSLDLYPENDPAEVDELLDGRRPIRRSGLRAELIKIARHQHAVAQEPGHLRHAHRPPYVKALIENGEAREWIAGRQLIDLVTYFPIALRAEHLRAITRPLAPRAYSIASSRREVGDEAHLLISAVRYESHGRAAQGVASNYVAERLKRGDRVRVKLRPNRHFALPAPDRDIIMVGPGTGVAPFRAFVQERRATAAKGRQWLFFGDRQFTHDFLYQLEWQDALNDGALTRMDVAFSRDQPEKIYVQDRIWERRARSRRMARRRRLVLCLRRCQGDGERRARHAGARFCRCEGAGRGDRPSRRSARSNATSAICKIPIEAIRTAKRP